MSTDTSEKGLEDLIVAAMTGDRHGTPLTTAATREEPAPFGGAGWIPGDPHDYDREYAVDLAQLAAFLRATQPEVAEALDLDHEGPTRRKFLARLQGEVARRGIIDVLRKGVKHGRHSLDLFYGTPSPGNVKAADRFAANRFSVTRQLRYSRDETRRALDLGLFINGLPIATFELKNNLTKQTVEDAVEQYRRDRHPRELLFQFGRCAVHFAVDEHEVRMCTHLKGKASWFLPFNQGWNDGAGNPPNPHGLKTDYLWKRVLTPQGLTDILENYAQIVEKKDEKTGKKRKEQIFPRYHQLDVVRRLLADAEQHGAGKRYLIEHSAGSGKSNSIAWLAHQLIVLRRGDELVFDSIIVVTDRRILDKQIRDTIKQYAQVSATVGHADRSSDLREFIESGKKIIISTVQKFPFILDEIGSEHRGRRFAIIIDEAHSSQGGRISAAMSMALSEAGAAAEDETFEDIINRIMESRKMLPNASYFAFTATPKNKTLEIFGEAVPGGRAGQAPALPQLHHEAGHPGGLYPRRAEELHAGRQLLQAGQDGRGRPRIRHPEGAEKAAPLRRIARPRHPPQGRDHGRSLSRSGDRPAQDRRTGAGHGRDQRHPARHPVLLCHPGLSARTQEPLPGHRRLFRGARVRRRQGHRSVAQRLSQQQDRRQDPGRALPLSGVRRKVPDRLR